MSLARNNRAMNVWAALNFVGGVGAAGVAIVAFALRAVCENTACDTTWLLPLIAAPVVTFATLMAWWLTGRRQPLWLLIGTAVLLVPAWVVVTE